MRIPKPSKTVPRSLTQLAHAPRCLHVDLAAHRAHPEHACTRGVGRHVTTLPGPAARLACSILRAVTTVEVKRALCTPPDLGTAGLAHIATLPGFQREAAHTLQGAWARGIDLATEAATQSAHPRRSELRTLKEEERHLTFGTTTCNAPPVALLALDVRLEDHAHDGRTTNVSGAWRASRRARRRAAATVTIAGRERGTQHHRGVERQRDRVPSHGRRRSSVDRQPRHPCLLA